MPCHAMPCWAVLQHCAPCCAIVCLLCLAMLCFVMLCRQTQVSDANLCSSHDTKRSKCRSKSAAATEGSYRIETSASLTHSTTVVRCRCTACVSTPTTFARVLRATYRMLLSLKTSMPSLKESTACLLSNYKLPKMHSKLQVHKQDRVKRAVSSTNAADDETRENLSHIALSPAQVNSSS